ncbi:hypothetical protein [Collimonas silvisoli]|uniref:hypothetical protein n=1 Tax=Collimonas silvisoli TaxID=2825884 RepID=UPI001B8AAD84|nr:hypothetical protein [Collimonas silvisoli]
MKRILCSIVLLGTTTVFAASFAGLTHEIHFDKNSDHIPASEVRAFVEWKIEKQQAFGDGEYDIGATINNRFNVTPDLAQRRADAMKSLIQSLGIREIKTGILDETSSRSTQQLSDTGYVMFQPPCTKTGYCEPKPIPGWKPSELNK